MGTKTVNQSASLTIDQSTLDGNHFFLVFMGKVDWINISIWATAHLPSPNPTLTLTCCQLTIVELGDG